MFRQFINRLLKRKIPGVRPERAEPAVIGVNKHGLRRARISSGSRRTVETLQENGYKAYIVGGAVRDLLAGMTPKDFDVATNATPEQVRKCFRRARLIGRRFQIVHVMMSSETIEVTTFRGHHTSVAVNARTPTAQVDDTGRVLRDNVFGSQKDDAARRDFTVNALYFDPVNETILDYHHGMADLKQKTLRMIGDPNTRYREDPVRMLRALRLSAKLDFSIDPATCEPIHALSNLIENVPPSRLFDEMLKLLTSGQAVKCLLRLREAGLHHRLLPLLEVVLNDKQGERFVMRALEKTDARVQEGKPISPGFLFATLLWPNVLTHWTKQQEAGERPTAALFLAMDEVLDVQAEKLAITHRIAGDIKDIWAMQPRFLQRSGKRPFALVEQQRFKAAYDFLLLRVETGEVEADIGAWWTTFFNGDSPTREALLIAPPQKERRKRKPRKPKTRTDEAEQLTPIIP